MIRTTLGGDHRPPTDAGDGTFSRYYMRCTERFSPQHAVRTHWINNWADTELSQLSATGAYLSESISTNWTPSCLITVKFLRDGPPARLIIPQNLSSGEPKHARQIVEVLLAGTAFNYASSGKLGVDKTTNSNPLQS